MLPQRRVRDLARYRQQPSPGGGRPDTPPAGGGENPRLHPTAYPHGPHCQGRCHTAPGGM